MKEPFIDTTMAQIGQRRSNTLVTIVREAIEKMIITGELSAGDRLNESALATRFDVSRGPIREACRSLEYAGLVYNVANQGVYVRKMSLEEARSLYEIRRALTALVGELLAERVDDNTLTQLGVLVDQMDDCVARDATNEYYELNLQFHSLMVARTGNVSLEKYYGDVVKQLHLFRRHGLVKHDNLEASNSEHREIVKALEARDGDRAAALSRDHVMIGWQRMMRALDA